MNSHRRFLFLRARANGKNNKATQPVWNQRAALRVLKMTNLQTGHRRNTSENTMKTLFTSTFIAGLFFEPMVATAQMADDSTVADDPLAYTAEAMEDATYYVTGHATDAILGTAAVKIGSARELVFDDEGRLVGVLLDIGTLAGADDKTIEIGIEELVAMSTEVGERTYAIVETVEDLLARPAFTGDVGTPPRAELTERVDVPETGLTTQSGPENETFRTIDKELEDAKPPIAGDLDVQSVIVDQEEPASD